MIKQSKHSLSRELLLLVGIIAIITAGLYFGVLIVPAAPFFGTTTFSGGLVAAPVLGVVVDKEMQVIDVESGSAAEQGGIKRGDIITSLNNSRPDTFQSTKKLFNKLANDSTGQIQIGIRRNGKNIVLPLRPASPAGYEGKPTPTAVPPNQMYF